LKRDVDLSRAAADPGLTRVGMNNKPITNSIGRPDVIDETNIKKALRLHDADDSMSTRSLGSHRDKKYQLANGRSSVRNSLDSIDDDGSDGDGILDEPRGAYFLFSFTNPLHI
jgi:hypothetical protein